MMVMTVHSAQFHVLSVYLEHLACNLHLLHTQVIVEMLNHITLLVRQLYTERIEIRFFGGPQLWIVQCTVNPDMHRVPASELFQFRHSCEYGSCGRRVPDSTLFHPEHYLKVLLLHSSGIAKGYIGMNGSLTVIPVQGGSHIIIGDMCTRTHPQLHLAENT